MSSSSISIASGSRAARFVCNPSLKPLKRGFIEGCRPLNTLDGYHTKRPYLGQLLNAIGVDPDNGWVIVEKEAREQ